MAVGDIYRLRIIGALQGQQTQNVLHLQQLSEPAEPSPEEQVIATFNEHIWPEWRDHTHVTWTGPTLEVSKIAPVAMDPIMGGVSFPNGEYATGDALPSYCAGVIQVRTGFSSRRKKGRFYIAGIPEELQTAGVFNATALGMISNTIDRIEQHWVDNTATAYFKLVVWSRTTLEETGNWATAYTNATSVVLNTVLATQRRRRIGVGV